MITESPLKDYVAAVSVGVVEGRTLLDLCYEEDFNAEVDMNVVMTGSGRFVEVQGTAEAAAFERRRLDEMLDLASGGIGKLIEMQRAEIPEGMLKLR
jgi:ribonuclease PH